MFSTEFTFINNSDLCLVKHCSSNSSRDDLFLCKNIITLYKYTFLRLQQTPHKVFRRMSIFSSINDS